MNSKQAKYLRQMMRAEGTDLLDASYVWRVKGPHDRTVQLDPGCGKGQYRAAKKFMRQQWKEVVMP